MKQLLLHIGYPKSGTTTLQTWLFEQVQDCTFVGKTGQGEIRAPIVEHFRNVANYGTPYHVKAAAPEVSDRLATMVNEAPTSKSLVALEGLTNPFADTHYVQPKDIYAKIRDIATLTQPLAEQGIAVKLLVTLRPQHSLLSSLFSQVYLQSYASGLFEPTYDAFLDFMLNDDIAGLGPDFFFDAFLEDCGALFGAEAVHAITMSGVFAGAPGRDTQTLAKFLSMSEEDCLEIMSKNHSSFPKSSGKRFMFTMSPAVDKFEQRTGFKVRAKAFGMADRLRMYRGKPVFWEIPDRSDRIKAYYADSNARLLERFGIKI